MGKAASYPARELRRLRWEWIRRNRSIAAMAGAGLVGSVLLISYSIWSIAGPAKLYLLGAAHVGLIAAFAHLMNSAFLAYEQHAIWQMRGAWGEDNTRSELQTAKRKGLIWGWVDSVTVDTGDIDHLVLTRRGGVLAIDSKWRNHIPEADRWRMATSSRKAAVRAEGILLTLLKRDAHARHRTRTKPVTVTPVVVVWGKARTDIPAEAECNGVRFIDGRKLRAWLASLDDHDVPPEAAKEVIKQLERFRATAGKART